MGKQEVMEAIGWSLVTALRKQITVNKSVITGNLRRNIVFKVEGDNIILTMVEYGKYVEYGTSRSRAKPFIRPVIHQKLPGIIKRAVKNYG